MKKCLKYLNFFTKNFRRYSYNFFLEKARLIENQGAKGGIVIDSNPGTTANGNPLFAMSGDGTDDVS